MEHEKNLNHDPATENKTPLQNSLPRHWSDLEELSPQYWENPKELEKRDQEFFEKPIEAIAAIDRLDKEGLERREFLTIMGASMALASLGFAKKPIHKIIPYVVRPEEITVGVPTWYASTYSEGIQSYGILIKNREGRPIKLEGNPDHPLNGMALSARAQASILDLYDPDRARAPIAVDRANGSSRNITWSEANTEIQGLLKRAQKGRGRVRFLAAPNVSPSRQALFQEFVSAFPNGKVVYCQPNATSFEIEAARHVFKSDEIPQYDFSKADVVLSLGADFMTSGTSPVENMKQWFSQRDLNKKNSTHADLSKFYCFESTLTVTGSNADERFGVRPGDEYLVACAILHQWIIVEGKTRFSHLASKLQDFSPKRVAEEIGSDFDSAKIVEIARELWKARGRSLVVAGGLHSQSEAGLALQVVTAVMNDALENEGSTVGASGVNYVGSSEDYSELQKQMSAGEIDILIIYRNNLVYVDPEFQKLLKSVPMVISISDRLDETALASDFLLPDHHPLENWGDAHPRKNLWSLQQPAIAPLHDTWAVEDMLIKWIRGAELPAKGRAIQIAQSQGGWHEYLKARWQSEVFPKFGFGHSFETFWEESLQKGVVGSSTTPQARRGASVPMELLKPFQAKSRDKYFLVLYEKPSMGDGSSANNGWLQEMPDPVSTVTWDNHWNVAPSTAKKHNLRLNDVVKISASNVSREAAVYVQPGMHPQVISLAVGYGRTAVGHVGNNAGVNGYPFAKWSKVLGAYIFSGWEIDEFKKTGRFFELALTQRHHRTMNRPIVNDITLEEFRHDAGHANHTKPHLRAETPSAWPVHEYKGYRWGMAVDLTACTGCGACVVACQAENNIPIVGRDRVRRGREMHWIRIDRYFSGSEDYPDVIFQPMMCQHCENASCETVCPVLATVHSSEGLNEMVYNRCVGTRYCQNNCPYKVRRFNFFDHWQDYDKPLDLAWNPDVTVRTRGVMEKCTFCVQRIQVARDTAKQEFRKIQDGDIKTACQQTCPTNAIVFGDINDASSRVSILRNQARAFRVLEDINNRPSVSYLTKVRNKKEGEHDVHNS